MDSILCVEDGSPCEAVIVTVAATAATETTTATATVAHDTCASCTNKSHSRIPVATVITSDRMASSKRSSRGLHNISCLSTNFRCTVPVLVGTLVVGLAIGILFGMVAVSRFKEYNIICVRGSPFGIETRSVSEKNLGATAADDDFFFGDRDGGNESIHNQDPAYCFVLTFDKMDGEDGRIVIRNDDSMGSSNDEVAVDDDDDDDDYDYDDDDHSIPSWRRPVTRVAAL